MMMRMAHPSGLIRRLYHLLIGWLVFALFFQPIVLEAQTRRTRDTARDRQEQPERRGPTKPFTQQALEVREEQEGIGQRMPLSSISRAAYESVILSGRYVVGPGDMFAVVLDTGEELDAREIAVGAGGNLVVPYVGSVPVAGQSLADVYPTIQAAIDARFQQLDITVTLSRLRTFPVNVIGEVQFPGAYGVGGVERVSELVIKAGGLVDEARRRASSRNIQILHLENGQWQPTGRRADLVLWNLTGKEQYNPFILDGEQIFVPSRNDSISVSGVVRRPGSYEYVSGDRISTLLALGGGLNGSVIPENALILRQSQQGIWTPVSVDLERAIAGDSEHDLLLQAGDKLYVRGEESWVYIEGEVRFPGPYPIEEGLTLKMLLERAQIKQNASLEQASLIRRIAFEDRDATEDDIILGRLLDIERDQRTDEEEALIALKTQQLSGRLPVDFAALIAGNRQQDIFLRDGDVIRLPRFVPSVRVYGAVRAPANIPYDSTYVVNDYILRAGGLATRAKKSEIVIIQGSTGNAISDAQLQRRVDPGDAIYIPATTPVPGQGYRIFRETLTVAASIASLILTIQAIR